MELVIQKITPAVVDMNIAEVEKYMLEVKEKYTGWVVTEEEIKLAQEERAKLNKLEKNISEVRKKIEKEGMVDIKNIIDTLKQAEKDTKILSNNISDQIKNFEEEEWKLKREEIKKIINRNSIRREDLREFIIPNEKWKNKTFNFSKIESEIIEQFEGLEKKKNFITTEIEKANSEINFKIIFENMKFLINEDYNVIIAKIENEKNKIKQTEENLRKKAEEEKQKEFAELEAKKEREKEEAVLKAQNQATMRENKTSKVNVEEVERKAVSGKFFDTTIRFPNAPIEFLKEFKKLVELYNIEYKLLENIEL